MGMATDRLDEWCSSLGGIYIIDWRMFYVNESEKEVYLISTSESH